MEINLLGKRIGSKTTECHRIWQKHVPLLLLGCFCFVVDGQIGVTPCDDATANNCPNFLPNSFCNLGSSLCDCPTGYVTSITNTSCEYECGALAAPGNGVVDTSAGTVAGSVATFSCDSTYKLSGSADSTCVDSTGWDNTATTCVSVEIGDSCASDPINQCNNIVNGQCQAFSTCECLAGYEDDSTGYACIEIDECAFNPCENGGACVDALNSYSCNCVAGYEGTNCETDINECTGDPCQNGGTCTDEINSYTCACVAGYDGDYCENNINECSSDPCQNGGTCLDGVNAYLCTCVAGYAGTNCETNIDECDPNLCQNGATCVDGIYQYTCTCVAGYDGNNCENNIDECIGNACNNGATCVDGINQYTCNCVTGYDGDFCENNIDECASHACQNGAACVDGINTYTCVCPSGYDGDFCNKNIDECENHNCQNGAMCIDGIDGYTCDCVNGYDGTFCQNNINECVGHSCLNGATCVDSINEYTCTCVDGYTGEFCATDDDMCPNDTDSRGTAWNTTFADEVVTITCNEGFTGQIYRTCGPHGQWRLPVYDCVREAVQNIEMSVEALDINSTAENIVIAIDEIVIATTYNGNTNTSDKITNGELSILTSSLKKIATLLPSLVSNDTVTDGFMDCVDNLIDDTNSDTWKSETDSTNAEQILSAIDSIIEAMTVTAEQDGKRLITKKNIAIQAQLLSDGGMIFPDSFESFDQDWINQAKSSIRIQSQSLLNSTEAYVATAAIYRNMSDILPNTYSVTNENTSEKKDDTEKKVKINGPVLAMTIPSHLSRSLDSPITITFEHYNNNLTAPVCVFWQYQSDSRGFWSDDGCRINSTNASSTVCECNHLTNFAVLMSPFQQVDEVGSSSESMILHIVSIVGISTSILCLIATFVIHFALWKHLKSERTTRLIHLCVALFVAYIVFLAGINRTENKAACTAIAAFLHYIYLVVFCLMLAEGIQIAMIVLYVFKTKLKVKLLLITAWGVPAVVVGISLLVTKLNGYGNEKFCWLSLDNGLIWSFVGPAVAVIIFNTICIGLVIRALCSTKAMETKPASEKVKASLWSLCVLLPVMGISWIVGLFYIDDSSDSVQYIFAILNGLQGFFIFLFHCLLNKQIREAIKLRQKRQSSKIANRISVKRSTLTADSSQERSKGSTDGLRYIGESRHRLAREASASTEYSFTEPFGSHDVTTYKTVEPQDNHNNGTTKQEEMFSVEDLTSGVIRQNLYIKRDKSVSMEQIDQISLVDID